MMELTRKGEYAMRGIIYLASRPPEQVCLLSEIAAAVDVPPTFLAKIFQQFSKTGLVKSYRGTGGGFVLGRPADQITVLEVIETIEGVIAPNRCVASTCPRSDACPLHPVWLDLQRKVREILNDVTLQKLAE